jgi:hypothetical protein
VAPCAGETTAEALVFTDAEARRPVVVAARRSSSGWKGIPMS